MVSLLLMACAGEPGLPPGDAARPDLVLVSVDTLRADHVSSYGYSRETTPFLDRLAAAGTRFSRARSSAPWTLPSHTTMLTGQTPRHHRVVEDDLRLAKDTPMLQERLQAAGYATGGFVATFYLSRTYGFERGFDTFDDFGIDDERQNLKGEVLASDVVDRALRWIGSLPPGKPAFVFVHVYDAHYAYDPPAPYDRLFDRAPARQDERYKKYEWYKDGRPLEQEQLDHQIAQYDESIRYVDDQLARLSAALERAGREARWAVTADHGEEFGERGSWGHAHTLYAEQLHVPLILSGPGIPAAKVVDEVVGLEDLAPTLAGLTGTSGLVADGLDLGALMGGASLPTRAFVAETCRFSTNRVGVLSGDLRLEWDLRTGERELFDLGADPVERYDLASTRAEDVARLSELIRESYGTPWTARSSGTVSAGSFLTDQPQSTLAVSPGQRFVALPTDGPVAFIGPDGSRAGPWYPAGHTPPGAEDPLQLDASGATGQVSLSDAQREALEALGYVQEE